MFLFKTVIGRVIEVRRFVNGSSRWARWGNWRERHEFWLAVKGNVERKWIVQTATFPARRGHAVVALVRIGQLIGLFNESTGKAVNYLRTDRPSLLRLRDLWVSLLLLAGALSLLGVIGLALALPVGLIYTCAAMAVQLLVSRHHAGHIDTTPWTNCTACKTRRRSPETRPTTEKAHPRHVASSRQGPYHQRGRPTKTTLDTSLDRADNGDLAYPGVRTAVVPVETQRPGTDGTPTRASSRMKVRRR